MYKHKTSVTPAIATVSKMMENLPEQTQVHIMEHLREYLDDTKDEIQWNRLFKKTQPKLIAAAKRAKEEIAKGKSVPLDLNKL